MFLYRFWQSDFRQSEHLTIVTKLNSKKINSVYYMGKIIARRPDGVDDRSRFLIA